MAERGPHPGLTTALLFLAACLAVAGAESYQKFVRQHVDFPTTEAPDPRSYCNLMMRRRDLATSHHCKHLNTFVHADTSKIQLVCGEGGAPTTGDLRESNASFPLTLCQLQKGSWAPDCSYKGTDSTERIIIACEGGFPVHLETEVPADVGQEDL
ncbi:probable inactive ribonuclease-like protein 12 [Zootoca vivipara]|uniref:probable inactive ribonuclease-like protein 12 n=1 Tax=Zootoca vivipara TaxID=8524 RepID=UPI00159129D3|nr:probable inactive ribonuclease-like protein 12 [Zootoca vivipara]XP_034991388.1 probable inactive ribonuclease-like protein 12 [Zootoca vivipara]XP_034991390.1 probable inactive ribonuclease-like protein 12 [Zootoca vivipara]XP_034991391.1 probable inactive ribonuclease-like protein 12 [Zootoca vivipara]XP_060137778.1 probable inactive ribonuclease-like protein 12 [Zootoca vivipara]